MNDYTIKQLSNENIQDLIPIYKNAFDKIIHFDYLHKKINTQLLGEYCIGFIAYDQLQNPAAFYGVYPCQIEFKGKLYLFAQSGDTMTHSLHSGKGLFTKLATETHKLCFQKGFDGLFAFPNENSLPGFIGKLGWSHIDDITPYLIRVKCIPWIRLKSTFGLPQTLHNKWCRFILKKVTKGEPFKSSCLSNDTAAVDHSEAFFAYKTYEENYIINVNGIKVWVKFNDIFLIIGDIEVCDELSFKKVIRVLKKLAFKLGLPHLRFQFSSNTWGESILKKFGTPMQVKYPIVGFNFTDKIPMEKIKFTGADNDTF
ncbi:MAG: GNAT family N-acetyltransferase [Crocinitomicaceae bacterium]